VAVPGEVHDWVPGLKAVTGEKTLGSWAKAERVTNKKKRMENHFLFLLELLKFVQLVVVVSAINIRGLRIAKIQTFNKIIQF